MEVLILAATPALLLLLVSWEERKKPENAVLLLLALVLLEAIIYPTQNRVEGGLFHPSFAGQSMRLPDAIIPMALLARVLVRGAPRRLSGTALAWSVFIGWLAAGLVIGVLVGNPFEQILFQGKATLYLGGGFALLSGVPAARLADPSFHRRMVIGLGIFAALIAPLALARSSFSLNLPITPGAEVGRISPDASTLLSVAAIVGLLMDAARRDRRLFVALASVPLLLSPLLATQRGATLGAGAALAVLLAASVGRTWRRRIRATPTEALLLLCVVLVPVLLTIAMRAATADSPTRRAEIVPLADTVTDTFLDSKKAQSASARQDLWRAGLEDAAGSPVMGWGLGRTYSVELTIRTGGTLEGGGFHNILIDLLVRRGAIGVVLFVVAVGFTMRDAVAIWRHHLDRRIAVFAAGCGATLAGLLAKGLVESLFEKFRLVTLFGVLIGAIASAASSMRESADVTTSDLQPST